MNEFRRAHTKMKPLDEQADWVCSFVEDSAQKRSPMEDVWDEVEHNYLVRPPDEVTLSSSTAHPLQSTLADTLTPRMRSLSILKDPETHQEIVTIVSKIALALFPHDSGFVQALGVGFEDVHKSRTTSRLVEYIHRLPDHYIVFIEWLLGAGIFGTGVIKGFWHYQSELRRERLIDFNDLGQQESTFVNIPRVVYDDPRLVYVDIRDFYPDPGSAQMSGMCGAAERFKITASEAYRRAARGLYNKSAVESAVERALSMETRESRDKPNSDDPTSLSYGATGHADFVPLVGYEYFGETPFKAADDGVKFDDGVNRRVITVLAGETVRSDQWPRRIPFFDVRLLPRLGSFYGVSPGEVIRYDQDFADTLKMMLADAVVRATHPPMIYDKNADVQLAKLRAFKPRVPIGATRPDAVQMLKYDPPVQPAFMLYSGIKQQMREASGALGVIQGLGLGSKRFSATESAATFQQALDRPELFAQIVEREYLPQIGRYVLELYREFLPDGEEGRLELQRRVGESEVPVDLSDIMPEFDVKFVGSRVASREAKQSAYQNIFAASANPIVAQLLPWIPLLRRYLEEIGAHDIGAMVGNPDLVLLNTMLTQIGGTNPQAGNGNGTMPSQPPSALMPAQVAGGAQV